MMGIGEGRNERAADEPKVNRTTTPEYDSRSPSLSQEVLPWPN